MGHAVLTLLLVIPLVAVCVTAITSTTSVSPSTCTSPYTLPSTVNSLYVATTGSDSTGTGTLNAPYKTISFAATKVTPGTTVFIRFGSSFCLWLLWISHRNIFYRGGVYSEGVVPSVSGTVGSPIVFTSYQSETAILDGTLITSANPTGFSLQNVNYIYINGFEIRNYSSVCFKFSCSYFRQNHPIYLLEFWLILLPVTFTF